nr:MAG TPA: hypothetical protein [Caudoviricetes sp.]
MSVPLKGHFVTLLVSIRKTSFARRFSKLRAKIEKVSRETMFWYMLYV